MSRQNPIYALLAVDTPRIITRVARRKGMSIHFRKTYGESLCHSCRRSTIVKGDDLQEKIYCHELTYPSGGPRRMPAVVKECSSYMASTEKSIHEMEKIAWLIELEKNQIGFIKPRSEEHRAFLKKDDSENYQDPAVDL